MTVSRTEHRSPTILTVKEENEQRHKTVVFIESNITGSKIDKLTSMLGKLSTHNRQSKQFKPRIIQGRSLPLMNSGRGYQYYNKNINRFHDQGRSYYKNRSSNSNRNNNNFRGGNSFRDYRNRDKNYKVNRRNVKDRDIHMTEVEVGIEIREVDLVGIEETVI